MPSLIDRLKARAKAAPGSGFAIAPPEMRAKTTNLISNSNRFDDLAYQQSRSTEKMGGFVRDLMDGDEHSGGERPAFEQGPELIEGLFKMAYKAAPELTPKRRLSREMYAARKIAEEVKDNPRLKDLQEYTQGDTTLSTVATLAMQPVVNEIIERMAKIPPPSPPGPGQDQPGGGQGGQGGGGGGGQGQPDPNGGQGQQPGGGQDPNGGQQPQGQQPQGGGGGGQPDPSGQDQGQGGGTGDQDPNDPQDEGNGPPPPPEEKDAEEGDASEYDQDLDYEGGNGLGETPEETAEREWEEAYDEALKDIDFERAANKALEAAQRETEELENLRKSIGLDDGTWATMDPSERMALAEELRTPEMKELANFIGRLKRYALGIKATRVIDVNHEAFNVETGNDLRRVLKHQLALLAPGPYYDITRLEFFRKYFDRELLQYKMRGHEDVGKGPIVICIDKSGSMNGQPFHWALGVAESLRRFAADDDRDIIVLFFGSNNDRNRFTFPKGHGPWAQIREMLGVIANGGTQFDGVLEEALHLASTAFDHEAKGKADIVFITDGQSHLSNEWIEDFNRERERVGVRVFSVYIGGSYLAADMQAKTGPLGLLDKISDACLPISELRPDEAREIFAKV